MNRHWAGPRDALSEFRRRAKRLTGSGTRNSKCDIGGGAVPGSDRGDSRREPPLTPDMEQSPSAILVKRYPPSGRLVAVSTIGPVVVIDPSAPYQFISNGGYSRNTLAAVTKL